MSMIITRLRKFFGLCLHEDRSEWYGQGGTDYSGPGNQWFKVRWRGQHCLKCGKMFHEKVTEGPSPWLECGGLEQ